MRVQPRPDSLRNGRAAPDLIRILAQKDDTEITFEPAVTGLCPSLNQGEFCDIFIDGDTAIDSSKPILVGHILLSTGGQSGDPGLAFAAPYEQFRERYTFRFPMSINNNIYRWLLGVIATFASMVSSSQTD